MKAIRNYGLTLLLLTVASDRAAAADMPHGFADPPPRTAAELSFEDDQIDDLLATLDTLLAEDHDPDLDNGAVANDLWTFRERLQIGILAPDQEARVLQHLDALAEQHPEDRAAITREQALVRSLDVGKVAPDIVGKDLDGQPFRLSDYRGRVVVIAFSGEWCGACRVEYPYQRLLMEVYTDRPFTMLSVNSDKAAAAAKAAKTARGLTYRSWWDGDAARNTHGPIAAAWGIMGWPTTYVLDERGVIRFVNLRQEDLLKAVKQLMSEAAENESNASSPR